MAPVEALGPSSPVSKRRALEGALFSGGLSPKLKRLPSLSEDLSTDASSPSPRKGFPLSPSPSPTRRLLRKSSSVLSSCSVLSTKSWFEDGVAVEDAVPADKELVKKSLAVELVVLADVKPHSKEVQSDVAMAALLEQVRVLSEDCFQDNCLLGCSKRGGWRITLLASGMDCGEDAVLLAFIVYRVKPDAQCVSISKLAVPEGHRRRGYGQILIQWVVQYAQGLSDISHVGLSSLAEAIKFYQRLGFKKIFDLTPKNVDDDEEFFPGQVYMELKVWKARGRRGTGARRTK